MWASNYGDEICLGATAGDRVLDKSGFHKCLINQLSLPLLYSNTFLPFGL